MLADFLADLTAIAPLVGGCTYAFRNESGERTGFLQLIPESPRLLCVHRIWTLQPHRGDGSAMLKQLCELADRHGIVLKLKALPFGSKPFPLSCSALIDWYERHGFEGKRRKMVREPKQVDSRIRRFRQQHLALYIGE